MSLYGTAAKIGLALAGAAIASNQDARGAEQRNPPMGAFVEADGVRLHYVRRGSGQPNVVIIHGNGTMVEEIAASGLLDILAQRCTVFAFDRPGFGHSERPHDRTWTAQAQAAVLLNAFDQLGIERPVVIGHSWGTLVALAMALDHPNRVAGLVLLSGYYYPTPRADVPVFSPPAIPVIGEVMSHTTSPILAGLLMPTLIRKVFSPASVPLRFKAGVPRSMMLRPGQLRASAEDTSLMIPAAAAMHDRYRGIQIPTVIVAGAGDRIVDPERHAAKLHREVPHSRILLLQKEGHMVHHGAVALVADAIRPILDQAENAGAEVKGASAPASTKATRDVMEPDSPGG